MGCLCALSVALGAVHPLPMAPPGLRCGHEGVVPYPSPLNATATRICEGTQRPQRVCVVGGGMSGVHLAWLLRRRGFLHTRVFERDGRLGGKIQSRPGAELDGITRELGAAFLSPDYVETRALLRRFGQQEVPISVSRMVRMHANGTVASSAAWFNRWVAEYTRSSNPATNAAAMAAALQAYFAAHREIFGNTTSRFPGRPTSAAALAEVAQPLPDFLRRRNLEVLRPFFYQFFDMQGMGLMDRCARVGGGRRRRRRP